MRAFVVSLCMVTPAPDASDGGAPGKLDQHTAVWNCNGFSRPRKPLTSSTDADI